MDFADKKYLRRYKYINADMYFIILIETVQIFHFSLLTNCLKFLSTALSIYFLINVCLLTISIKHDIAAIKKGSLFLSI